MSQKQASRARERVVYRARLHWLPLAIIPAFLLIFSALLLGLSFFGETNESACGGGLCLGSLGTVGALVRPLRTAARRVLGTDRLTAGLHVASRGTVTHAAATRTGATVIHARPRITVMNRVARADVVPNR